MFCDCIPLNLQAAIRESDQEDVEQKISVEQKKKKPKKRLDTNIEEKGWEKKKYLDIICCHNRKEEILFNPFPQVDSGHDPPKRHISILSEELIEGKREREARERGRDRGRSRGK